MDGAIVGPGDATGWWFQLTPLKNDGVNVTWDDDIPKMMGKLKKNVPNHQPSEILDESDFSSFKISVTL